MTQTCLHLRIGYADQLPADDRSVDLVFCINTAHWLDQQIFFKECDRILQPNGVVALAGYGLLDVKHPNCEKATAALTEAIQEVLLSAIQSLERAFCV